MAGGLRGVLEDGITRREPRRGALTRPVPGDSGTDVHDIGDKVAPCIEGVLVGNAEASRGNHARHGIGIGA
jgi:hypothetical protein